MRQTQIFSGSSHPALVDSICERLGQKPAQAALGFFSNGETSVEIKTSIRDQHVFIVQSGSPKINDAVIELLIMINACRGGSASKITAVLPYFPYSRQSKKKSHRGAITARMLANQMAVAGVTHVTTIDLHASQMQGFFQCPVDNLVAEPILARWIKHNVPSWQEAVVVSKNAGGTKRVTSLADALKLSFGIVMTDRRRPRYPGSGSVFDSTIFDRMTDGSVEGDMTDLDVDAMTLLEPNEGTLEARNASEHSPHGIGGRAAVRGRGASTVSPPMTAIPPRTPVPPRFGNGNSSSSIVTRRALQNNSSSSSSPASSPARLSRAQAGASAAHIPRLPGDEEYTDEPARDVTTGRLVHGHIVDDDHPSPPYSTRSGYSRNRQSSDEESASGNMMNSFMSTASSAKPIDHALGGTGDAADSDEGEEEDLKNPELETTVTLVGKVRDKPVIIVDDMIDKAGSWIAAAETVVKRGGATRVYCMATHGLFGGDCLAEMEGCNCINEIIVTNTLAILPEKARQTTKLTVLDVSNLLAEAIRRTHHGESISQLFQHRD
ncbi:phosphoribosyl pyrophosphokinase [Viridothelium virens]|uniref:Ribose-phosphate pyrophosphokinase 1 n=1 Tax=Viridothelium virens TaxID=1048519 RepID=A0A6A6H360_VIRVR|nr:phosphoribosyl pyrophosphokinase [Viridothelium virens]